MTMTAAEAKNAAVVVYELRNAPSGTLTDDVRLALADSAGFADWPPAAGTEVWEIKALFNAMGYEMFEDFSIVRDTATYPTTIGVNSAAAITTNLYLATLDPGGIYSDDDTRAALWAYLPSGAQSFLTSRFNQWGYTVFEDLSVARSVPTTESDTWGFIAFDVLVDGSTGSFPLPSYPTYGSTRHVPNSTIDITQYTGTGAALVTYSVRISSADYTSLLTAYRAIPRLHDALVIQPAAMGEWYIDSITDTVQMIDGRVMCSITFREFT